VYAILGEDDSDVEMLFALVRRIAKNPKLPIKTMGYCGCGELLTKGARQIKAYQRVGCKRFIICYDSDYSKPINRYHEIVEKVIKKSGVEAEFCALVPIQEIESWILADIGAVTKVISSWVPDKEIVSPELIKDPKEYLEKLSKGKNLKPRYTHATHNSQIAQHLNLEIIIKKCTSSLPLFELVQGKGGNYPLPKYSSDNERREDILKILKKK
jgi:hypothetical protein